MEGRTEGFARRKGWTEGDPAPASAGRCYGEITEMSDNAPEFTHERTCALAEDCKLRQLWQTRYEYSCL